MVQKQIIRSGVFEDTKIYARFNDGALLRVTPFVTPVVTPVVANAQKGIQSVVLRDDSGLLAVVGTCFQREKPELFYWSTEKIISQPDFAEYCVVVLDDARQKVGENGQEIYCNIVSRKNGLQNLIGRLNENNLQEVTQLPSELVTFYKQ